MTTVREEAREGSFPAVAREPESTADARVPARGSVPLPLPVPSREVTERVRAVHAVAARAAAYLDRPGSLAHAHPPTFARARELHHERAARHAAPALRAARLTWGYIHMITVKPVLNGLEWATETPLRFLGSVLLAFVIWHWS